MGFADGLIRLLTGLPVATVFVVAGLLVSAETATVVGAVLPTEPVLLLLGYLAARGTLSLMTALVVVTCAALVGDWLAYAAGRRYGPRLRAGWLGRRVGEQRWEWTDRFLARYGGWAVMIGRWLAVIRTLTPRLAGVSRVRPAWFALGDLAGVVVWVPGSVLIGYLARESYSRLSSWLGEATTVALVCVVAAAMIAALVRVRFVRRAAPGSRNRSSS